MREPPVIQLDSIGVKYSLRSRRGAPFWARREPFWALRDVCMEVRHGEIMGVIGKNGAGKSTVLRVIAGILAPDKGQVAVHGLATLLSIQAGFAPRLDGRDNIVHLGMLLGLSRAHMKTIAPEIIDFAELGEFMDQPVFTFSTGMRARLAFSVAMHANPNIVLLDETLSVGDAWFQKKSSIALSRMISDEKTVVAASHNVEVLRKICDRVLWIDDGATRTVGPTDDVLDEYLRAVHGDTRSPAPVPTKLT